ncbi:DUF6638 family protein [Acidobacteriota bacterium]
MGEVKDNLEEVRRRIKGNLQRDEISAPLVSEQEHLLPIHGRLASRYLRALKAILGRTCRFDRLHVDRRGWSPEVASRLGEGYLAITGNNPVMVIVSPDQVMAPLYHCENSFDEELCNLVYTRCRHLISTVLPHGALWGEFDYGVSLLTRIDDLLLVEGVEVTLDTPDGALAKVEDIAEMAKDMANPKKLASKTFLKEMTGLVREVRPTFKDPRKFSDLGARSVSMDIGSFTTEAFGRIWVLRGEEGTLIVHRKRIQKKNRFGPKLIFAKAEPEVTDHLLRLGYVEYNPGFIQKRLLEVEDQFLCGLGHDVLTLPGPKRKRLLNKEKRKLPLIWRALTETRNRLHVQSQTGQSLEECLQDTHPLVRVKLVQPVTEVPYVQRLLAELDSSDYLRAYKFHPEIFMRTFLNSPDTIRKLMYWTVISYLRRIRNPKAGNRQVNAFLARYPFGVTP